MFGIKICSAKRGIFRIFYHFQLIIMFPSWGSVLLYSEGTSVRFALHFKGPFSRVLGAAWTQFPMLILHLLSLTHRQYLPVSSVVVVISESMSRGEMVKWRLSYLKTNYKYSPTGCKWPCILLLITALCTQRRQYLSLILSSSFTYKKERVQCTTGNLASFENRGFIAQGQGTRTIVSVSAGLTNCCPCVRLEGLVKK